MRARETREGCLLLARPFFLVPTTSKRLLRRLGMFGISFHIIVRYATRLFAKRSVVVF